MATIVRGPRAADHFTIISNHALRDERLSWKARGLLAYLLSMDTGWNTSVRRLATVAPDGKSAVDTALTELETCGYLERRQSRADGDKPGTFSGTEYHVRDDAAVTRFSGNGDVSGLTVTRFSDDGSSDNGSSATKKTSPKKTSHQEDSSSSAALRAATATTPVETSSSSNQFRNASAPDAAAANPISPTHSDAPRADNPGQILTAMMLNTDEQRRFRDWLITETGARNPEGLVISLHSSGRLSDRLTQWRTSENTQSSPEAPQQRSARLEWCGTCDPQTRMRDDHEVPGGREYLRRCPNCNINAGIQTPGAGAAAAIAEQAQIAASTRSNHGRAAFEAARATLPAGTPRRNPTIGDPIDTKTALHRAESEHTA